MKRLLISALCCLALPSISLAQLPPPRAEVDVQSLIEQLFPVPEEELPHEEIYEALFQYYQQPLNLNAATTAELQSLLLLTDMQIQSLLRHRKRNGPLLSLYELQAVPGWDLATIQRVLPFVHINEAPRLQDVRSFPQRIWKEGQKMLLLRYERVGGQKAGYQSKADTIPPAYLGSPDKLYARFRLYRSRQYSIGLTLEKDAGEALAWNPGRKQYGADFISFHALLHSIGRFKKVVLGDFQLQFGQGLVYGSGFSLGKGAETITTLRRSNIGIRPYTSLVESGYFRGAGFTYAITPGLELSAFYSNAGRDALLHATDSLNEPPVFGSMQLSGFHRTLRELEGKGSLREQSAGSVLQYATKSGTFKMGVSSVFTRFNKERQPLPRLYQLHAFKGRENWTGSFFAEYLWQNISFFGEAARSRSGGNAIVAGFMTSLSPSLDFSFLYRNYSPYFHSFYGAAFAEGGQAVNEKGAYWGLQFKPSHKIFFSAYYDLFSFPWLRYRVHAPNTGGHEWLLRATYKPSRELQFYGQLREEVKGRNSRQRSHLPMVVAGRKRNYLLNLDFAPQKHWSIRSRVQWSSYLFEGEQTKGYTLLQDVTYQWKRLALSGRIALFQTDDYDNRQYVYEKDVLWAFSIPAYYGKGIRQYVLLRYKIAAPLSIWFRWARTIYTDRSFIGSGTEKMEGTQFQQFKAQIRWNF